MEAYALETSGAVFGESRDRFEGIVTVRLMTYRARGHASLHSAEGVLNLPAEKHSHGLRLLAAREKSPGFVR